tara:strand:- start:269 stop:469 length:201 start_codon:yes stop_codon:yes gene_type:complete
MTYEELLNIISDTSKCYKHFLDQTVTIRLDESEYMPIVWYTIIYNSDILDNGHLVLTKQSEIKKEY